MKKSLLILGSAIIACSQAFAGGLNSNTNVNATFGRMMARGASIDIDGVYYNPAGLSFLKEDGFHLSITNQSAFQNRNVLAVSPLFPGGEKLYKGKATAPVIPSFQAAWKHNRFTVSAGFAINGGGGKCTFDEGLPQFSGAAIGLITGLSGGKITPDMYSINSSMVGKQYIYGVQAGLSFKVCNNLSLYAGARVNIYRGGYEGHLLLDIPEQIMQQMGTALVQQLVPEYIKAGMTQEQAIQAATQYVQGLSTQLKDGIQLNCDQSGTGVSPIFGIDAKFGRLNLAAKYEMRSNITTTNKTKTLIYPEAAEGMLDEYKDGVKSRNDIPALLKLSAGFEILPCLRANVEWHWFDDKSAKMPGDRQQYLTRGTYEYLAGLEWDITKMFTISGGFQKTSYGLSDMYQTDTSFACNSYSLGFGGRINFTQKLSLDVSYFWTKYSDYTKKDNSDTILPIDRVYSRSNKVLGVSLNYKF